MPGGVQKKVEFKWQKEITRNPVLKNDKNQNERKFGFIDLGSLIDIVIYRGNWGQVFQPVFINKNNFERRIKDIKVLRDPISHTRTLNDQDVIDGTGGLLWLSNTLCIPDLNPYG